MKEFIFSGNVLKCYGCRACEQICPQKCIHMNENSEGFIFPQIDQTKCIGCNLCEKVCPVIPDNHRTVFNNTAKNVYVAWNVNITERMNSSSGGIFTAIANFIFEKSGVVYGCSWKDERIEAHQIRITSVNEISNLQGSKYVQSTTENTFSQVKDDLKSGLYVMYTGTPCQIAGLKLFLRKEYEKLICVDFICHGTPSPKVLSKYVDFIEADYDKIWNLKFRDKKKSGYSAYLSFETLKRGKVSKLIGTSPYMVGFYKGFYNRESCYLCDFTSTKRVSDITISDYWGLGMFHPEQKREEKYGVSCIISNTAKGNKIITSMSEKIMLIYSTLSNCSANQPSLSHPNVRPQYRDVFFEDLEKEGFKYLSKKKLRPRLYYMYLITPTWIRNVYRRLKK